MTENRTGTGLRSNDCGPTKKTAPLSFMETLSKVSDGDINFKGRHFKNQDLRAINLDGLRLSNAVFSNCNLSHANLSEAKFLNCDFIDCEFFEACFAYSDLQNCRFLESRFGHTDFAQADLNRCTFSGPSTFSIDFHHVNSMTQNIYLHDSGSVDMNMPPYSLKGFKSSIIFLDDKVLIEGDLYDLNRDAITEISDRFMLQLLCRISPEG